MIRAWRTIALLCVASAIAMGCGESSPAGDAGVGDDARTPDAGDPCVGLTLCTTAGTSCEGDTLVTCAEDANGCLVETSEDCTAGGGICDASGTAACVDPCASIPAADRCTTEGRSCDGDSLVVCAMDAGGCLVRTTTDCAAMDPVAACDDTGAMPVCAATDPCAGVVQCGTSESRSCDGNVVRICAADAMGCFVETTTDCTATDEACSESGGPAQCVDLCASVDCTGTGTTCSAFTCNPLTGACDVPAPATDGTACDDSNDCTSADVCTAGVCGGTSSCAFSYFEDFEGDDGGWTTAASTAGGTTTWEWGTPAGGTPGAARGTGAWAQDLDGNYEDGENSFLISPVLDLSAATTDPILRFDLFFATEPCCDDGWLEVSTDGGTSWTTLGPTWGGWSDGWQTVQVVLAGTAGQSAVRIRFGFDADGSGTGQGFAVDDVLIRTGLDTDLAVTAVDAGDGCPTATTPLRVTVQNLGTAAVTSFDVTLEVDGGAAVTETVTATIAPGETHTYTSTATFALASPIEHVVTARATLAGDDARSNDARTAGVFGVLPIGTGYAEDFEGDDGHWRATGHTSWEHGTPAGTFIPAAAGGTGAWVTNLTGIYGAAEDGQLESVCFDFSALTADPTLSFSHIFQTESCCDEGYVEVWSASTGTWERLGTSATGTNWYNDTTAWNDDSGASGAWRTASHPLTGTAGESAVRLRVVFTSDGTVAYDGMGVDDVSITP